MKTVYLVIIVLMLDTLNICFCVAHSNYKLSLLINIGTLQDYQQFVLTLVQLLQIVVLSVGVPIHSWILVSISISVNSFWTVHHWSIYLSHSYWKNISLFENHCSVWKLFALCEQRVPTYRRMSPLRGWALCNFMKRGVQKFCSKIIFDFGLSLVHV